MTSTLTEGLKNKNKKLSKTKTDDEKLAFSNCNIERKKGKGAHFVTISAMETLRGLNLLFLQLMSGGEEKEINSIFEAT